MRPDEIVYMFDNGDIIRYKDLTRCGCDSENTCPYAGDPYNTNGDCLAMK